MRYVQNMNEGKLAQFDENRWVKNRFYRYCNKM